ncbi:ankyrin repeat domain-containing protein [Legionella londiniensis]|uniref:ankyrin repeat domain-containing protein n=1 Tax=Legionella londiniensis TaxID=45068 RepID=UPI00399CBB81
MFSWLKSLGSKDNNEKGKQTREAIEETAQSPAITVYAALGQIEAVRKAIKNGADVDARNETGATALIIAASRNDFEMVKLLIEEGESDPDVQDHFGKTPADWSEFHGNQEMLNYLKAQVQSNHRPFC